MLANPYILVATAIGLVVAQLYMMFKIADRARNKTKELTVAQEGLRLSMDKEVVSATALFESAKKAAKGSEQRKVLINEINKQYGGYLKNQLDENTNNEALTKSQNDVNKALLGNVLIKNQKEAIDKALDKQVNAGIKKIELETKIIDINAKKTAMSAEARIALEKGMQDVWVSSMEKVKGYGNELNNLQEDLKGTNKTLETSVNEVDLIKKKYEEVAKTLGIHIVMTGGESIQDLGDASATATGYVEGLRKKLKELQDQIEKLPLGAAGKFEKISNEIAIVEYQIENTFKVSLEIFPATACCSSNPCNVFILVFKSSTSLFAVEDISE